MKRTLTLMALLLLAACSKVAPPGDRLVTISIGLAGQTKAATDAIAAALPASVDLQLVNTASRSYYYVTTGSAVTIPAGTYDVTGTYRPAASQYIGSTDGYLSTAPAFTVADAITVTEDGQNFSVAAAFDCFAVAVDAMDVATWTAVLEGVEAAVAYAEYQRDRVVFVIPPVGNMRMTVTPSDPRYEQASFNFTTNQSTAALQGATLAENGHLYVLRPRLSGESVGLAINFPGWTEHAL